MSLRSPRQAVEALRFEYTVSPVNNLAPKKKPNPEEANARSRPCLAQIVSSIDLFPHFSICRGLSVAPRLLTKSRYRQRYTLTFYSTCTQAQRQTECFSHLLPALLWSTHRVYLQTSYPRKPSYFQGALFNLGPSRKKRLLIPFRNSPLFFFSFWYFNPASVAILSIFQNASVRGK